ncbi:MAG: hypothetical protein RI994_176 [Pseudomonadota bacterium]
MSENNRSDSQEWRVDYLMLAALWGSSFLFMRMGAAEFGPLATAWTRVCVATLFLFPLMLWQGHWALFKSKWKIILSFGVFNSALPFALFAYAVMHISTGLSAILNAAVPLFAALVAWLWLDDRLNRWRIAGLFIGFMGVTLLASNQTSFHTEANPDASLWGQYTAIAACLVATLCYAISGSFTKKFMPNLPPLVSAAGIFNRQPIGRLFGACIASVLGHARSHAKHSSLAVNCHIGSSLYGHCLHFVFQIGQPCRASQSTDCDFFNSGICFNLWRGIFR